MISATTHRVDVVGRSLECRLELLGHHVAEQGHGRRDLVGGVAGALEPLGDGEAVLASRLDQASMPLRRQPDERAAGVGRVGRPGDQPLLLQLTDGTGDGRLRGAVGPPARSRRAGRARRGATGSGCRPGARPGAGSRAPAARRTRRARCSAPRVRWARSAAYRDRRWTDPGRDGRMSPCRRTSPSCAPSTSASGCSPRGRSSRPARTPASPTSRPTSTPATSASRRACGAGRRWRQRWRRRSRPRPGSTYRRSCSPRRS